MINVIVRPSLAFYRSKLKPFAVDKINVTQTLKFALGRIENIVGESENAGYQEFLLFPQFFKRILLMVVKSRDFLVKG